MPSSRRRRRTTSLVLALLVVGGALLVGTPAGSAAPSAAAYTPSTVPGPSVTTSASFTDVDCWSPGYCVAVGQADVSGASESRPVVAQETAGTWKSVAIPFPTEGRDTSYGRLDAVSCPAADQCVAVGQYGDSGGPNGALAETLSGSTWTASAVTTMSVAGALPGAYEAELVDVSCPGVGSCTAVGTSVTSTSNVGGLVATLSDGAWTPSPASAPTVHAGDTAAGATTHLFAVSCVAAGDCVGVGRTDDPNGYTAGVIERLTAGTWTAQTAPEPGDGNHNHAALTTVACAASGRCVAGGTYGVTSTPYRPDPGMIDDLAAGGSAWSASAAQIPAGAAYVTPRATSCAGDGTCGVAAVATGTATDSHAVFPVVEVATGGSWTAIPVTLPADGVGPAYSQVSDLATVSCASADLCVAGGSYANDTLTGTSALIVTVDPSAGTATSQSAPLPGDAAEKGDQETVLTAARCLDATHCTLLGRYDVAGGTGQIAGYADSDGGVVTPPPPPPAPPAQPVVRAVSPRSGPASGGRRITVTGTGFTGATGVRFGSTAGGSVVVVSATTIQVVVPRHTAGSVDVRVTTAAGTSTALGADRYTYLAAPRVTSLSPGHGSRRGGTSVTVHGSGFTGPVTVRFGTAAAKDVRVVSDSKLSLRTPKHAAGTVHVIVTAAGGTSAATGSATYRYR